MSCILINVRSQHRDANESTETGQRLRQKPHMEATGGTGWNGWVYLRGGSDQHDSGDWGLSLAWQLTVKATVRILGEQCQKQRSSGPLHTTAPSAWWVLC